MPNEPIQDDDETTDNTTEEETTVDQTETETPARTPVAAAPEPTVNDDEFGALTPREKLLVEKARAQEKKKLYNTLNETRERLRTLEAGTSTPRPASSSTPPSSSGRSARDAEIASLHDTVNSLKQSIERQDQESRAREVRTYRREQIQELRRAGVPFIEALVMGDTEEMIDLSIETAKAEAAFIAHQVEERVKKDYGLPDDATAHGNNGRRPVVVKHNAPARPAGVPAVVSASNVRDSSDTLSAEQITAMSDWNAIRNGTYAANRDRIHEALKTGKVRL